MAKKEEIKYVDCRDCAYSSNPHNYMVFCSKLGYCRAFGKRKCILYAKK
nr:MAG TPA: hypothetical protein [Caudoviricetes sp.]